MLFEINKASHESLRVKTLDKGRHRSINRELSFIGYDTELNFIGRGSTNGIGILDSNKTLICLRSALHLHLLSEGNMP